VFDLILRSQNWQPMTFFIFLEEYFQYVIDSDSKKELKRITKENRNPIQEEYTPAAKSKDKKTSQSSESVEEFPKQITFMYYCGVKYF